MLVDGVTYPFKWSFDNVGRMTGRQFPDGDTVGAVGGTGSAFAYDEAGRLKSIPGVLTGTTYNARGQLLTATYRSRCR